MPQNIDFSTNTWQQLVFWEAFAASYSRQGTNTFVDRPTLRTYGFGMDDPYWFMYLDKAKGSEFAREALLLRARGLTYDQLVQWVGTNYSSTNRYCEDNLDLFLKALSSQRN